LAGIYIHIPFCKQACYYCDFHFSTKVSDAQILIDCIKSEITMQKNYLNEKIETLYFGGGTPSILSLSQIDDLILQINNTFEVSPNAEITLEANPDDLSEEKLLSLKKAGINRLSIGVQSFDKNVLKFLNRAHDDQEATNSIKLARQFGFENISVDLIYGIPDRSHEQWVDDLKKLIDLNPEHISSYCLTIEPQTVFGNWSKKGKLVSVEDDYSAAQFDIMVELLAKSGYEQYEVSNFCKADYYSKHNTAYWQQKHYLGLGPSAHSYNLETRQYNVSNNQKYIKAIQNGEIPYELEPLNRKDKINDYILTTLRTKWGTDIDYLKTMNYCINTEYLEMLINKNIATFNNNILILTSSGRLLADKIASDLFIIE
jgi:oxygen-independent coproporphyrinogen-3 oxidase